MLLFWVIAAVMLAAAAALLARPLLRARGPGPARADYDLAVYRDQLAEVDRDLTRGVLTADQAAAARLEIERRILAAAPERGTEMPLPKPNLPRRGLALAVAIGLPLGALVLYLALGHPELSGPPPGATVGNQAQIEALVKELAGRMAAKPADPRGWQLLARTYALLGRFPESADAYAQAIAHGAKEAEVQASYGEALTLAANGQVTVAAAQAFDAALAIDPKQPRARYYQALARSQAGKKQEALDLWVKLEAESPPNAEWLGSVDARIKETAAALGLDPATLPGRKPPAAVAAAPAPGPTAQDMQAAATMTPEERTAFIRGMVGRLAERLKQQPDDLQGWQQLAQSYGVLDDRAGARDAWAKAAALAPGDFDIQANYAEAMLGTQQQGDKTLPPGFADVVKRMQGLQPKSYVTLYYGGLVERANGNVAGARAYWQELLATLPADLPIRAQVQRNLNELGNGG
ncbi:MAG TPA: c-type cytochrome biogenesis protein CcmI [Methylomirabilota bacterium]|nr:c-type cytochrome biogenesis protein CcmI [Methylomirabilota bacterium]